MNQSKFKKALRDKTACNIQANGWCCGTCFSMISKNIKDWQSLLYYRGDYTKVRFKDYYI